MKLRSLFSAVALCSVLFVSCDKDDSTPPNTEARVQTYIEEVNGAGSDTFDITYDASNRATMVANRNGLETMSYAYPDATSSVLTITESGTTTLWQRVMANSNGLVDSTVQSETAGDTLTEKYFYNGNNQVVEMREYELVGGTYEHVATTQLTYDANGNRTIELELDNNADTVMITTYTYNSTAPVWYNSGIQFMPVVKKHQPTSITVHDPVNSTTEVTNITYEMDAQNRITSETFTSAGSTYKKSYIYF